MNLILVRNLKTKNLFRIAGDSIEDGKKVIHYKEFNNPKIYFMVAKDFWKKYDILSTEEIKKLVYV